MAGPPKKKGSVWGPGPAKGRARDEKPRDEKPRDEKPRDEKPRDEKPRDEKPRDEKPRDDKPRDDKPGGRPPRDETKDRPRGGPRTARPARGGRPRKDGPPRGGPPRGGPPRGGPPRGGPPRGRPPEEISEEARQSARVLAEIDEVEVRVEKLVSGGEGLARHEGVPIFIPRSAPGDRLRVKVVERKKGYGRAEIVEILDPGPGRREPPCPYFERCGGCDLQHLDESHQLRAKVEAAHETLRRLGAFQQAPGDVQVVAGASWGYRLRTQLQVGTSIRGPAVGYFSRRSHEFVPVESCPVLVDDLEEPLTQLPKFLDGVEHERLDVVAGDGGAWSVSPVVDDLPKGEVTTAVGGFTYTYDGRCFFQGHRQLLPRLVELTLGEDDGEEDGLAVDLYAGVGLFTLPLARRYGRVVAVEGERVAARFARLNARRNKLANVEVEAISVDGWLRQEANFALRPARVIVDPPRAGLSGLVRRWLREARPPRLTYVSCHAAALARDLKFLAGVYRVDRLALVDLFPQTGHLELVLQLSLNPVAEEAPAENAEDVAAEDVKAEDVAAEDVKAEDVAAEDVAAEDVKAGDVKAEDVAAEEDVKAEEDDEGGEA